MSQLLYTIVISNIPASFHLWRNENLVKHQKVSKYYAIDYRLKILKGTGVEILTEFKKCLSRSLQSYGNMLFYVINISLKTNGQVVLPI